ncbi:MAG TPA: hypothetical protein VL068_13850, partial [Microthrixaceae bacterium]|nr:hypothetical protein [Microthrixaceae bacterium]
ETVSTAGSSKGLSGTGKGTIQIGDMTHEVTMNRCTAMFGAIGGDGVSVSEPDNVEVYFELPPDDWSDTKSIERLGHTGMVRVEIEDTDLRWVSGSPELEGWKLPDGIKASDAALTERNVTNDGRTMEGRATFVEMNSPSTSPNPVSGTFSFSCPPAG